MFICGYVAPSQSFSKLHGNQVAVTHWEPGSCCLDQYSPPISTVTNAWRKHLIVYSVVHNPLRSQQQSLIFSLVIFIQNRSFTEAYKSLGSKYCAK